MYKSDVFRAVYDSRGANVIILITSKKGTINKIKINFIHWTDLLTFLNDLGENRRNLSLVNKQKLIKLEFFYRAGKSQSFDKNEDWIMDFIDQSSNTTTSFLLKENLLYNFGRVDFSFRDFVLVNASDRYNGASQLSEENQWNYVQSASFLKGKHNTYLRI